MVRDMEDIKEILDLKLDEECECKEQELYTIDEVVALIDETTPKVEVDTEECQGASLDVKEFTKGIVDVSRICGKFSALKSVGMTNAEAIDIIVNQDNVEFNLKLNSDTGKANVEVAKAQSLQISQNQI